MKSSPIVVVNHTIYPTFFCPSLFRTITTQPRGYSTTGPAFTHQPAATHHHQTPTNKATAIHSCGELSIRFQINREDAAMIAGLVRLRNLRKTQMWSLQVEKKSPALELSVDTAFKKRKLEALEEEKGGEERGGEDYEEEREGYLRGYFGGGFFFHG
jgi:hypothetical protein